MAELEPNEKGAQAPETETDVVQPQFKEGEYVPKMKFRKSKIDYDTYRYYDKRKGRRFVKFLHRIVSNTVLRLYLRLAHHVKVVGKAHVKALKKKGAVIVSNHIHPLDIQMISIYLFGMRPMNFLSLARNMDLRVGFLLRNAGAIPIPEDHDNKKRCFEEMNRLLQDGNLLQICPEGSLSLLCNDIRPFKDGAFRFAAQNQVPLLPVTLRFEEYNKKGKKYKHPRFTIDVSEPIYPDIPQDLIKQKAERVMRNRCNSGFIKEPLA